MSNIKKLVPVNSHPKLYDALLYLLWKLDLEGNLSKTGCICGVDIIRSDIGRMKCLRRRILVKRLDISSPILAFCSLQHWISARECTSSPKMRLRPCWGSFRADYRNRKKVELVRRLVFVYLKLWGRQIKILDHVSKQTRRWLINNQTRRAGRGKTEVEGDRSHKKRGWSSQERERSVGQQSTEGGPSAKMSRTLQKEHVKLRIEASLLECAYLISELNEERRTMSEMTESFASKWNFSLLVSTAKTIFT